VSTVTPTKLRIGEVAELTGTTPRTIRYYEEIGLLSGGERIQGKHRCYTEADVERMREILRLRDLLGLSLEELTGLLGAEEARAELRRELERTESPHEQTRILEQALVHIENQLSLVRRRRDEVEKLERELVDKRRKVRARLKSLGQ
jgi:DNA-binding transcriptional MerR regulator